MREDRIKREAHSRAVAEIIREMGVLVQLYGVPAMIEGASRFMGVMLSKTARESGDLPGHVAAVADEISGVAEHHMRRTADVGSTQGLSKGHS